MELAGIREPTKGGFNFDNCMRNARIIQDGFNPPVATKTGTTIAGIIYKDGVILGGDTRATMEKRVSDKNSKKVHYLRKNIYCCGAGTAADTHALTASVAAQMELHALNTGRSPRVATIARIIQQRLYRYGGAISAAIVLGGVDDVGSHVFTIDPDGSVDSTPYVTMGSGSLAAMSVFELNWKPDMDEASAKKLMHRAIMAGGLNDLGSGCYIDLCVIRAEETDYLRNMFRVAPRVKKNPYEIKRGSTRILSVAREYFDVYDDDVIME